MEMGHLIIEKCIKRGILPVHEGVITESSFALNGVYFVAVKSHGDADEGDGGTKMPFRLNNYLFSPVNVCMMIVSSSCTEKEPATASISLINHSFNTFYSSSCFFPAFLRLNIITTHKAKMSFQICGIKVIRIFRPAFTENEMYLPEEANDTV